MSCKSSCLGPCNLAPRNPALSGRHLLWRVTKAAIDRIVSEHLLGGRVVEDFAYQPTGHKQTLRPPVPAKSN